MADPGFSEGFTNLLFAENCINIFLNWTYMGACVSSTFFGSATDCRAVVEVNSAKSVDKINDYNGLCVKLSSC